MRFHVSNPQSAIYNPQSDLLVNVTSCEVLVSRRAVYTGSFDPITLGHLNVIERSSRLVDELIVGVGINIDKESLFTAEERQDFLQQATSELENVEVKINTTVRIDLALEVGNVNETVSITAEAPLLQTDRADTGRLLARLLWSRACCCSTNPSAPSTPRCARSCGAGCAICTTRFT